MPKIYWQACTHEHAFCITFTAIYFGLASHMALKASLTECQATSVRSIVWANSEEHHYSFVTKSFEDLSRI
jgi:hypothetical protein